MTRPRTWTDEQLTQIAPDCDTTMEIVVALGLGPYARNRQTVQAHAARLGIALPDGRGRRVKASAPAVGATEWRNGR